METCPARLLTSSPGPVLMAGRAPLGDSHLEPLLSPRRRGITSSIWAPFSCWKDSPHSWAPKCLLSMALHLIDLGWYPISRYYEPHFTEKKTEPQRGLKTEDTLPGSDSCTHYPGLFDSKVLEAFSFSQIPCEKLHLPVLSGILC